MQKEIQIQVFPEEASSQQLLKTKVAGKIKVAVEDIRHIEILRRSIDARRKPVRVNLKILVFIHEDFQKAEINKPEYGDVSNKEPVLIIGAGPAGLFAALKCIELGKKPVLLERGKDVRARRRDLKAITVNHHVDEDSNYCFGEGGAGTYSDGKLYTRSKKRGDVQEVLKLLVGFGAEQNILVDAHPHIGTNKLPALITEIREFILEHGGEVIFNCRVADLLIRSKEIEGVVTQKGNYFSQKSDPGNRALCKRYFFHVAQSGC